MPTVNIQTLKNKSSVVSSRNTIEYNKDNMKNLPVEEDAGGGVR